MITRLDFTGRKIGKLTVIARSSNPETPNDWVCLCECGKTTSIPVWSLHHGNVKACGCLRGYKHGHHEHPLYQTWINIKNRCYNPKNKDYPRYGARGITMCDRWRESLDAFIADVGHKLDGCTLDRIDNNGPYAPENVRWADIKQQANNKRNNRTIEFRGERGSLADMVRRFGGEIGLTYHQARTRIHNGWSVEETFTTKPRRRSCWKLAAAA